MRFLEITLAWTLYLTEALIAQPSPHAIISHTWGADSDEVAFDNLKHRTGKSKSKSGYAKLWFVQIKQRLMG